MRTAVVRVNVDSSGVLTTAQLDQGMTALLGLADEAGAEVVHTAPGAMPVARREVQLLIAGSDADAVKQTHWTCAPKLSAQLRSLVWSPMSAGAPTTTPTAYWPDSD